MDFHFNKHVGSGNYTVTKGLSLSDVGNVTVSTGNLVIGTAGKGIDFTAENTGRLGGGATDRTASVLDDYEEGTFSPVFSGGGSYTYNTTVTKGQYVKIGRKVTAQLAILLTGASSLGSNAVSILGLPFSTGTGEQFVSTLSIGLLRNTAADNPNFKGYINSGNAIITLTKNASNAGGASAIGTDLTTTTQIYGTITYMAVT